MTTWAYSKKKTHPPPQAPRQEWGHRWNIRQNHKIKSYFGKEWSRMWAAVCCGCGHVRGTTWGYSAVGSKQVPNELPPPPKKKNFRKKKKKILVHLCVVPFSVFLLLIGHFAKNGITLGRPSVLRYYTRSSDVPFLPFLPSVTPHYPLFGSSPLLLKFFVYSALSSLRLSLSDKGLPSLSLPSLNIPHPQFHHPGRQEGWRQQERGGGEEGREGRIRWGERMDRWDISMWTGDINLHMASGSRRDLCQLHRDAPESWL